MGRWNKNGLTCVVGHLVWAGTVLLAGCASASLPMGSSASIASEVMTVPLQDRGTEDKKVRAQQLFVRGMTHAFLEEYESALQFFQDALQLAPNQATILSAAAEAQEALEDLPSALFYAEQARRLAADNVYYHRQVAQLHLRAGSIYEALNTYEQLLEHFPKDVDALQELAQLQTLMGHNRDAVSTYERLIQTVGDGPEVRQEILHLNLQLGDEEAIRATLDALIDLEPSNAKPHRMLGELLLQQDSPEEALVAFQRAYELAPNEYETVLALADLYRQLGRDHEADTLLDDAMNIEDATVDDLLARATPLYNRADIDPEAGEAAIRLLQRALEQDANQVEALTMLGSLRYQEGAFSEAADLLFRVLEQNPRDPQLWVQATAAYYEAGQAGKAADVAEEGLLLFPGQFPLVRLAAYSLMQSYQNDAAIDRFKLAIDLLSEEAEEISEHDLSIQQSELLASLGFLYMRKRDSAESDAYYTEALKADPDNTFALNNYAFNLADRGAQLPQALEMVERAVELDPNNAAFLDTRGWIYFKQEEYDQAKIWLSKALEMGLESASVFDHYGDVAAQLGDLETARQYWQKAFDLAPDNASLREKLAQ